MRARRFSRVAFPIFAWGLVLHSLVIAVLFGALGLGADAARTIAAWKEAVLILLVVTIAVRSMVRRTPGAVVCSADLLVGGLISVALCYVLAGEALFNVGLPAQAQILGFRDSVFFMLLYFVGRGTPELVDDDLVLRRLFVVAVVTSLIAILERLLVSPEMLVGLGIASYFQEFLGLAEFTAGNDYGLPMNYWAGIGGVAVRRAGSVFLSAQGFAVPFLLLFPLALTWAFRKPRQTVWPVIGFAVASVGLLLTITRTTTAVAFVQLLLFVVMRRKPEWGVLAVSLGGAALVGALLAMPGFASFLWDTVLWQESSAVSHLGDWQAGAGAFFERPWGWGLGTADQTAVRSGLAPLTGDNLYLKYAVEMGVAGIFLLVGILGAIGYASYRLLRSNVPADQHRLGTAMFLATVGIALNAVTGSVFNSVPLGWLYFWLAGVVVTLAQRAPRALASPRPAPVAVE